MEAGGWVGRDSGRMEADGEESRGVRPLFVLGGVSEVELMIADRQLVQISFRCFYSCPLEFAFVDLNLMPWEWDHQTFIRSNDFFSSSSCFGFHFHFELVS